MATHHTFFGKIFGSLADIFKSASEKLWDSLSDQEKADFKNGTGIFDTINKHIAEAPDAIKAAIEQEFPDEDINRIETELIAVADFLHLDLAAGADRTITGAIAAIQDYLKGKSGGIWQSAISAAVEFFMVLRSPDPIYMKIATLANYAYLTFWKK